jgi:hypothetical protein
MHGGRVWVDDRADGEAGARFVIELPAEMIELDDAGPGPLAHASSPAAGADHGAQG